MLRTIGFKIEDGDLASLNQRLICLGYESIGPFVRDFARGLISNNVLVEELAKALSERLQQQSNPEVNERLTLIEKTLAGTDNFTLKLKVGCQHRHLTRAHAPH